MTHALWLDELNELDGLVQDEEPDLLMYAQGLILRANAQAVLLF